MEKLGFGLMRLPVIDGDYTRVDIERFKEMADAFIAAGGTYFDTAYPYHGGFSERAFCEAVVKRYPRESFTVTDKLPLFQLERSEQMEELFCEQLHRCGVEYFDYYWLHALSSSRYELVQRLGCFEFIAKKKAEGKIRHIGFSFHDTADVLDKILTDHPEVEYVQLQINYLDWEDREIQSRRCYEVATAHGKPVIVMEPIKGGMLANLPDEATRVLKNAAPMLSVASWAVRYAASLPNVFTVLSGMSNMEQIEDNVGYMRDFVPLGEREMAAVDRVKKILNDITPISCTACRYCVSENECPANIPIPDYFALYNEKRVFDVPYAARRYESMTKSHGKASDCAECGECERHCPQKLNIRELLREVAAELESN